MDCLTSAPSFRPTRPTTRSRTRARPMSPSPRPNPRRPFTDTIPNTMFITTDYDYDYISPSSPDADLIFHMSPIQSHILSSSPPGREPINVMTLRNKTQKKNSPPLSPLLYSFPRPSRLHSYIKQTPASPKDTLPSKPLASISQNKGALTLDSLSSLRSIEAVTMVDERPLTASLVDSFLPPAQSEKRRESDVIPPSRRSPTRSPPDSHPSSPIPIPRHTPRQSDPGPFVSHPVSSHPFPHKIDCTPLPSSGLASHVVSAGRRSDGKAASGNPPPAGSSASLEPLRRIEGFDDSACDPLDIEEDKSAGSEPYPDFRSSVISSTAYSISDSAPFRFSRYLDPDPEDQGLDKSDGRTERSGFLMQTTAAGGRRGGGSHRGCARS